MTTAGERRRDTQREGSDLARRCSGPGTRPPLGVLALDGGGETGIAGGRQGGSLLSASRQAALEAVASSGVAPDLYASRSMECAAFTCRCLVTGRPGRGEASTSSSASGLPTLTFRNMAEGPVSDKLEATTKPIASSRVFPTVSGGTGGQEAIAGACAVAARVTFDNTALLRPGRAVGPVGQSRGLKRPGSQPRRSGGQHPGPSRCSARIVPQRRVRCQHGTRPLGQRIGQPTASTPAGPALVTTTFHRRPRRRFRRVRDLRVCVAARWHVRDEQRLDGIGEHAAAMWPCCLRELASQLREHERPQKSHVQHEVQ